MPSLNVAEYIDECILSALNQTLLEKEIICIDAGSTDGTWEKLSSYASKNKKIMSLFRSDIKSYGYQVNLGIRAASGEYIAILETDDYIKPNMYERLYNIAISNNADYAKADYDSFITYSNNKRIYDHVAFYKNGKYNSILNPRRNMYLYLNDHTIWRGIYKRNFLIHHSILLHETRGAAFQDIGFSLQVLSTAKRAIYIDDSFYRYRIDRAQSSINSINGLKYSYWEFSWLLGNDRLRDKIVYADGVFASLVKTFSFELVKALRADEYDVESQYIKGYYAWFKNQILNAVDTNMLSIDLYKLYPQLHQILENINEFSLKLKTEDLDLKKKREALLIAIKEKTIILFGLGSYGSSLIKYLYDFNINILAACDNNATLWGSEKYGLHIYSPMECTKRFSNSIYVIANKRHSQKIYTQLINLGIEKKNIYIYS